MARKTAEEKAEKKKDEAAATTGTMSVADHLRELRDRIIWSLGAVAIGAIICFIFFEPIIHLMVQPYRDATGKGLVFTQPLEAFMTRIKVAAYGGFVVASPVVFFHLWRFVTPGLNPKEKRYAIPFVASSVILFVGGSFVAIITFPKALNFLLGVGGKDIDPLLTAGSYLTLVFLMILAFGISFEFPIVMMFLLLARIITTRQLRSIRKFAFLGIVVFAAVVTPSQDPISLFAMAIPMYLLYEVSILIGRILKR
ncbi:MAG: sec-independent protein translocase protein TatC [Actinomycetota bacterium]|nr:sec-independent protein translocase protein TatC [Actinomycetota bacterium]